MAHLLIKAARDACDIGITKLKRACSKLERNLPPLQAGEVLALPADRPRVRTISISACQACIEELEAMETGERAGHVCTHGRGGGQDDETRSVGGSEDGTRGDRNPIRTRNKQPKLRVVMEYMEHLDSCLDIYTDAVAKYCTVLTDENDKEDWENHLLTWSD